MEKDIAAFKLRMENDLLFCQELFRHATIRLLAHKYCYYILAKELVKDSTYDAEEYYWRVMGLSLGLLNADDSSPCIDFDFSHPLASEAIATAHFLKPK